MAHFSYTLTDDLISYIKNKGMTTLNVFRVVLGDYYNIINDNILVRSIDEIIINKVIEDTKISGIAKSNFVENIIRRYFHIPEINIVYRKHNRRTSDIDQKIDTNGDIKEHNTEHYRNIIDVTRCARCGYDEFTCAIHVHHIDHNHKNDDPSNLIALCANCHTALHSNRWKISEIRSLRHGHENIHRVILVRANMRTESKLNKQFVCEKCKLNSHTLVHPFRKSGSQSKKQEDFIELCPNCVTSFNFGEWELNNVKELKTNPRRSHKFTLKMFLNILSNQPMGTNEVARKIDCSYDVAQKWLDKLSVNGFVCKTHEGYIKI